jgi:putative transposase
LRFCAKTKKRNSIEQRISRKVFKFTANLLDSHLKYPTAKNSLYNSSQINHCLIQLSLTQSYAESGLTNLQIKCSTNNTHIPTGRTFRTKTQRLSQTQIHNALTAANDQIFHTLKSLGVLRRKATVAIDYTTQPFYGNKNAKNIIGGKRDRGTNWGYTYASIDLVEAGRRFTIYTTTVTQFSEKATIVEELITKAKARGVHVAMVLLDRGFYTVEVIAKLKTLGVYFIIPAVKNNTIKEAMQNYDTAQPTKCFTLGNNKSKSVTFNLYLYKRSADQLPKKKKRLSVSDLYFGFATNLPQSHAAKLSMFIPTEYRRRWGIETGYRVQDNAQAKTTSVNYTLRLLYQMVSVLLYNVWHYANFLLCKALEKQFVRPVLLLSCLAVHFEGFVIGGLGPPSR